MITLLVAFILLAQTVVKSDNVSSTLVVTKVGVIRGVLSPHGDYNMFLGIPYAQVDATFPFGASSPQPVFDEVYHADNDSVICPQIKQFSDVVYGNINCLQLNVYVPTSANTSRLPVMVWMHGGAYTTGNKRRDTLGPDFLVRHDVILVTVNYRLGVYGFMCLDIPEVPGNAGLKDQYIALRWVKDNIESFGGDVNRITAFGNSAGGRSIEFHLLSSHEKLFSNMIIQSGSAFSSRCLPASDPTVPLRISKLLGFETQNVKEALSFMSTIDSHILVKTASSINTVYRPCVEKNFEDVEPFISDYAINLDIPKAESTAIMLGFNNYELLHLLNKSSEYFLNYKPFHTLLNDSFDFTKEYLAEMENLVRRFYNGDEQVNEDATWGIINYWSDIVYTYPADRSIQRYIKNNVKKLFYYMFSYSGERNVLKKIFNITRENTAAHGDETGYLFEMVSLPETPREADRLIIDRMTTMWTNFAKYGDPTPETSQLLPVKWTPITNGSAYHYLNIDSELTVERRPYHHRFAFWDLFYKLNGQYEKGYRQNSASSGYFVIDIFHPVFWMIILIL